MSLVVNSQKMLSHANWQSTDAVPLPGIPEATVIGVMPSTQTELVQTFSALKPTGKLAEITAAVQALLPGATRLELLADRDNTPYLSLEYPTGNVPVATSGDGIHALIRLGLDLAVQAGGIALVEEPEVHLHPAGLAQAAKLIWSTVRRGVQVVLTTHSLEFIDALLDAASEPDDLEKLSLFLVQLKQGELCTARIPGKNVAVERQQIGADLR